MITVTRLTRRFGSVRAVDDVSFSLARGEVVGFLGPNGAGKTTTMRMLTGYLAATSGSIEVAGFDVARESLDVRRRIGYLPEAVPLYPEHRVEEMLALQGRLHGLDRARIRRRSDEVLERVGLGSERRRLVGKLSKGQRQRVGLAVALLHDPEVLILDEPTSGLDPLQRIEVRALVRELAEERTVLLSSHILPEVEAVCPRVIILRRGRIVADGLRESLAAERSTTAVVELAGEGDVAGLLGALDCVHEVRALEAEAPWRRFSVAGDVGPGELLGEALGTLAHERGWRLRELSVERPSLERLFTRIATGLDEGDEADGAGGEVR